MGVCLPNLTTSTDNYVFTADVLATGTDTDYGAGIGIIKKTNNGTGQGMVQPNSNSSNHKHTYLTNVSNSGSVLSQVVTTSYVVGDYHTHRLTKQGTSITYEILHNNTVIFTKENTVGSVLATETVPCLCVGRWESGAKFKNIKVESLSPSPTPTPTGLNLSFNSSTYTITDFFDGVTVSCTLTGDGNPMSGETVTFSWENLGLPASVTAITNSSGVATTSFDYFSFDEYPATVTATYGTATDTCTIQDGT